MVRTMPTRKALTAAPVIVVALFAASVGGCRRESVITGAAPAAETAAPPQVVAVDPPNGATDVDPSRTTLQVTFDRPMDRKGWAWVVEGPETAPELGPASFDAGARTSTVQARLQPGRTYVVWVNSPQYAYFKDTLGRPATPYRWTFATRSAGPVAASWSLLAGQAETPRVAILDPPNGATGVAPGKRLLRATFDRPMAASWSWVTEGAGFPPTTGAAYFEPDGRTAALPVELEPATTYVVWLNSEQFQLFRDTTGRPATPLRWTFTTAPS
jgi:RNA polymerase sigma-70 factor (ECF subfamily)